MVLLDTGTPGTSREIFSDYAGDGTKLNSFPAIAFGLYSSMARALGLYPKGCEFESHHRQYICVLNFLSFFFHVGTQTVIQTGKGLNHAFICFLVERRTAQEWRMGICSLLWNEVSCKRKKDGPGSS